MGLLDSLFTDNSGGGLLDFLRNNATNQQFSNGGAPGDQAQYGQPMQANAQMHVPQQPPPVIQSGSMPPIGPAGLPSALPTGSASLPVQPQGLPSAPQPAAQSPGIGNNFMTGLQSFSGTTSGGLIGKLINGIGGLSGQRTDPAGMALQLQQQQRSALFQALRAKDIDPQTAMAAALNPELSKALIDQYYGKDNYSAIKTGQDGLGRETYQLLNKSDGTLKPIPTTGSDNAGGLGDMSKSGPEYLASMPKAQQGIVQGMIDGTIQPPSSFALAKPYWQGMLAAAKNVDPEFDANKWTSRHMMSGQIAQSGNSSMGGILSNGKSAFAHLSDLSASMADLGNASHDFPGGGSVAAVQNYLGNKAFAGSDTLAKIKAINDNLGHYGQESTKFYSGTGGGVEERMNALKEMNPNTTSSEEMASYLAKEKSLMTDRLQQKEAQIRDTMGDSFLQKHPVFTPQLQQTLNTIDANIAKLKSGTAPTSAAPLAPTTGEGAIAHNPKTGETIIRKNGKWVPFT